MRRAPLLLALLALLGAFMAACSSARQRNLPELTAQGQFGRAAARIESTMTQDRKDRNYLLDRMSLGIVRLGDGQPKTAEPPLLEVFDTLRTQGINDDKTVAAAVFGEEGVIFWKGEPFEQALAYTYIAIQRAERGEWDNARAAAASSLFLLKDFGDNERGARKSTQDIAEEAVRRDESGQDGEYLDKGYTPTKTNFALGYLMAGISNLALAKGNPAREDEARDHLREAFTLEPGLRPISDVLIQRRANTIFVVDYGLGPRKTRYGSSGALARFVPVTASDPRPLNMRLDNGPAASFAWACDVNRMAADHMWNNFEDVRQAKSVIGQGMMLGGALTAASSNNQTGAWIGLGLILGGLLTSASAQADIRHCEVLPQRTYVAVAWIPDGQTTVSLEVPGDEWSRLKLIGIAPPEPDESLRLYYIRLPFGPPPHEWALSGSLRYGSDALAAAAPGDELPYILGGRCVRSPSHHALLRYQQAGYLTDMTVADLENLYRLEGIVFEGPPPEGHDGMHVLEGGRWMGTPVVGSTGFARLFCTDHEPYQPRSKEVAALAAKLRPARAGQ